MPVKTHQITAVTGSDLFRKQYSDGLLLVTNGFQLDENNGNPVGSYFSWESKVDNDQPASSLCQPGLITDQSVYMRYKVANYTSQVKGFPAAVVGTMFGRGESSGVECSLIPIKTSVFATVPLRRANIYSSDDGYLQESPCWDMDSVNQLCGLPSKLATLPDIKIDYDVVRTGGGIENLFLDMYLHDVSTLNRIPGGHPGPGYGSPSVVAAVDSPATDFLNTLNGINYNLTKDWNINVWMGIPPEPNSGGANDSDGNWAGGVLVGRYTIGGVDHDFYYKIETNGANNFDYIGLVQIGTPEKGQLSIQDYMNWAKNDLPTIITNNPTANAQYNNPGRGKPPPRFPDDNHVLGGTHFGTEVFHSNPNGAEGVIQYKQLQFTVPGKGVFGWKDTSTTGEVLPYLGQRELSVGETLSIDMAALPQLAAASTRNIVNVTGDATAVIVGNQLQLTAPPGASGFGEIEVELG